MTKVTLLCFSANGAYCPLALRQLSLPIGAAGDRFPYRREYVHSSAKGGSAELGLICMKFEAGYQGRGTRLVPLRWVRNVHLASSRSSTYHYFNFILGQTVRFDNVDRNNQKNAQRICLAHSKRLTTSFERTVRPQSTSKILCVSVDLNDSAGFLPKHAFDDGDEDDERWTSVARALTYAYKGERTLFGDKDPCFTRVTEVTDTSGARQKFDSGELTLQVGQSYKMELWSLFLSAGGESADRINYRMRFLEDEAVAPIREISVTPGLQFHTLPISPLKATRGAFLALSAGDGIQQRYVTDISLRFRFQRDDIEIVSPGPTDVRVRAGSENGTRFLSSNRYALCETGNADIRYVAEIERPYDVQLDGDLRRTLRLIGAVRAEMESWELDFPHLRLNKKRIDAPPITKIRTIYPAKELDILLNGGAFNIPKRCKLRPAAPAGEIGFNLRIDKLGKAHTAFFGQTGSGKSYSLGVMVEEMLRAKKKILVLDPNSDFIHFAAQHRQLTDKSARIDYAKWCGDAEPDKSILILTNRHQEGHARRATLTWEKCQLSFSDFTPRQLAALIGVERGDVDLYAEHRRAFEALKAELPFGPRVLIDHLKSTAESGGQSSRYRLAQLYDNFEVANAEIWSSGNAQLDAKSVKGHLAKFYNSPGPMLLGVDLGSIGSQDARLLVAGEVLKEIKTLAEKEGGAQNEIFIVIDEAHNVVPAEGTLELQKVSGEYVNWIAGEGRKYGLRLVLVTQRPSKIHPNSLGMVANLVCMKVTNLEDLEVVKRTFGNVPSGLLDEVPRLHQGAAVVSGTLVDFPCLLEFGSRLADEGL